MSVAALALLALPAFFIAYFIVLELFPWPLPKHLPRVGFRNELFANLRASARQISGTSSTLIEGYAKYAADDRPFIVPDTTVQPQVMLPQKYIKWLATQPESVLSAEAVRVERNAIKYLPTSLRLDPKSSLLFVDKIIGQSLSQSLDLIQADMHDEIRWTVDREMGTDAAAWRDVDLAAVVANLVDATANRVMFGAKLSRDKAYLRTLRAFIICMGLMTLLVGQMPPFVLRPLVGRLLSVPTWVCKRLVMAWVRPLVEERMRNVSADEADDLSYTKRRPDTHDFVTQSVRCVKKFKIKVGGDMITYLVEQFLILGFAAMATTGAAGTNIMLDIMAASRDSSLWERLRGEAAEIFRTDDDWASPAAVKRMVKTDSTIRESLRKGTLQSRGLLKEVMAKEGVTLPDGTHVPCGTWLGVPVQAMQLDDKLYPDAHGYDPLRYERLAAAADEQHDASSAPGKFSAAVPSDKYLSFSYGRSSCPGRWFAALQLKLIIAYITLNYDIQPLPNRPKNMSFGDASIASFTTHVNVRRRVLA